MLYIHVDSTLMRFSYYRLGTFFSSRDYCVKTYKSDAFCFLVLLVKKVHLSFDYYLCRRSIIEIWMVPLMVVVLDLRAFSCLSPVVIDQVRLYWRH